MESQHIHELLRKLAACTATPGKGVTRFSYSPEDRLARNIVALELASVGCRAWTDWIGNIHALLPGTEPELPTVMVGSHLDSVRNGGCYDGAVGVVGALAALRRLAEGSERPRRGVRFVAFAEEEGSNFAMPLLGSKAFIGCVKPADLVDVADADGTAALKLISSGLEDRLPLPEWVGVENAGFMLELHVEQGASLDRDGTDIGVVECIAADRVLRVEVAGVSGHSGATAMRGRRDALAGAAEMITACETLANSPEGEGSVATVGSIRCRPNAFNCIAESAAFTVDIRNPDPEALERVTAAAQKRLGDIADRRSLGLTVACGSTSGVRLDPVVRETVMRAAASRGLSRRDAVSWAMHDAGAMAQRVGTGMIFIPSRDGVSHNPGEFTGEAAIEKGVDVLCDAVAALAAMGPERQGEYERQEKSQCV